MNEPLALSGRISVNNATEVLQRGTEYLNATDAAIIDFAAVEQVDSSVIAIMLEWRRVAANSNRALEFRNLRCNIRALAEVYGVGTLLPFSATGEDCDPPTPPPH